MNEVPLVLGPALSLLIGGGTVAPAVWLGGTDVVILESPGPPMVRIPGGSFIFGSTPEEVLDAAASCAGESLGHRCTEQTFSNELGRREVNLDAFWLDRTEVTVKDYARCVAVGRCPAPDWSAGAARFANPSYPMTFVTYDEARQYCEFRGARLPTEQEFERAARGRTGRTYPWGNLYNHRAANHGRYALFSSDPTDGHAELAPVGSYVAGRTVEGVLDLAGNAAEWTLDAYRDRYDDPVPPGNQASRRVVRGGSWARGAAWLRGAARESYPPNTRRPEIGFRCARGASAAKG